MLKNCRRCGRMFEKVFRDICPSCIGKEQEIVRILREYLNKNKLATIFDVVKDTDIALNTIIDLIDAGVLILVEFPNITIECQRCGTPTQVGRYCAKCKDELIRELANATNRISGLKDGKTNKAMDFHSR